MNNIDKKDRLKEFPFEYQITKSEKVIIFHEGKQIMILGKKESLRFISKMSNKSEFKKQLELAKVTGNFKRGNEKKAKESKK